MKLERIIEARYGAIQSPHEVYAIYSSIDEDPDAPHPDDLFDEFGVSITEYMFIEKENVTNVTLSVDQPYTDRITEGQALQKADDFNKKIGVNRSYSKYKAYQSEDSYEKLAIWEIFLQYSQ